MAMIIAVVLSSGAFMAQTMPTIDANAPANIQALNILPVICTDWTPVAVPVVVC